MPYDSRSQLPENIRESLPERAQEIWLEAFNAAEEQYDDEERAIKTAWDAVKNVYEQDEDGNWVPIEKGYVIKSENDELQYTLGVVYEPEVVDLQGEWTDEEEIRKAAWNYMNKLQNNLLGKFGKVALEAVQKVFEEDVDVRLDVTSVLNSSMEKRLKDMHSSWLDDGSTIVESYLAPADLEIDGTHVKKGAWLLGIVWSDEMWKEIKSGNRSGLSMGGFAERA